MNHYRLNNSAKLKISIFFLIQIGHYGETIVSKAKASRGIDVEL